MNMPTFDKFDPTPAVNHWMAQKKRRPVQGYKARQQEWFQGVFDEAGELFQRKHNKIVKF